MTGWSGRPRRAAWSIGLGIAVTLAAALTAIVLRLAWAPSARTMHFEVPAATVAVPSDAPAIERGRHLSVAVAACTLCHGDNLGGRLVFDHWLLGKGYTPNLTPGRGGIGASYRVPDWVRALRDGVSRDGRGLLFMPVDHYRLLSDADLGALIAYLKRLPPVDNTRTALELSPVARLMIDLGLSGDVVRAATIDHAVPPPAPPRDAGAYLVQIGGCTFCHGAALTGGRGLEPGAPRGPDLTPSGRLARDGYGAFTAALRAGTTADGRPIDPRFMPWQAYRHMTDAELQAIWTYLQGLPPAAGSH
jgi:cytochrome c553